jgi:hypothetical protein
MFRAFLIAGIALCLANASPAQACWGWRHNRGYYDGPCVTPVVTQNYYSPGSTYYAPGSYHGWGNYYSSGYMTPAYYYTSGSYHGWRGYRWRRWGRWRW